ncbi:hypothetical protein BT93_L2191 [Corymbia citriodora subsp. variegata]|uniref:TIR domain-containing protein n=1 Tax=Corymbia citriodora subsp. variegata TaxID=360336 RepID=A0A8T0CN44_CORYI|nr:hypothetical protein BT93_L2191 [Corymbia citriodora subsp. variegata]
MVFPLFYKVDPREVRTPRERYKKAIVKHQSKFGKNAVKRWEEALSDAGKLSGWHLKDEDESEFIQRIVTEISTRLDRTLLHVAMHPVGIYSKVVELKSMLNLESDDNVLMVGLWGQGGIGKTTLAKAIYNDIFNQFRNSCFLANVREVSKDCKDLVTLQEKLIFEILALKERLVVSNVDRGIKLIQERLCHKKILLILDDVSDLCQIHKLVGEVKWLCNGSRIIVTTRDFHLLTYLGIDQDHVYEVRELNDNDARELFSKHAFPTHQNFKIRTDLVDSVLSYAKGLPLALEVLGSFLRGRREYEWESALDEISTAPKKGINDVLKISYNGLEPNVKEIFLHIACFFKGWDIEYVKKVLDSCDFKAVIGLQILMERSLIRIDSKNIQMHDLIQLMGMDIVNQESDDPERRSRLWVYNDVVDVLSSDMEFQNLKYINFSYCQSIVHMPDLSCTPNLEELDFRNCKNLVEAHESITYLDKLQVLNLGECSKLSVFPNVLKSKKLRALDFCHCMKLERLPDIPHKLEGLKHFTLKGTAIIELPASIENLVSLEEMYIYNCKNLEHLPSSIYKLQNLKRLEVQHCTNLIEFPKYKDSVDQCMKVGLSNLGFLDLAGCNLSDVEFLENLSCFPLLSHLILMENNMATLPTSIKSRDHLLRLKIGNCHQLQEIPELPPFLSYFDAGNCESLQKNEDYTSIQHILWPRFIFILPEGEMPQWVVPIEEGSISFMVSEDLYDKILGLVFCFVLDNAEPKEKKYFYVAADVNGENRVGIGRYIEILDLDHILIDYVLPRELWGEVDFAQIDGHYIQFGLEVMGEVVKKWGFRIICKQLGEDLKAEIRDNQLMDPALLYEVDHGSTKVAAKSSRVHEDNSSKADLQEDLQDCQTSTEEHSQMGSKRKHEVNFPLGKRIKTMLTSIFDRWR